MNRVTPLHFLVRNLNDARHRYFTHDLEFYALVQSLRHLRHYWDLILYSNHDSLRHIQSQKHLSAKHAMWAAYLKLFSFVLKHKARAESRVADALS